MRERSQTPMQQALGLTDEESAFVDLLMLGERPIDALRTSGIAQKDVGRVIRRANIQAAIRERTALQITGGLLPVSIARLRKILESDDYPATAQVAAAKAVWSAAGILRPEGKTREPHAPVPDLPEPQGADVPRIGELEASLQATQKLLAAMHDRLVRAEPIDVTPNSDSPID